jgi:hypothetical protein
MPAKPSRRGWGDPLRSLGALGSLWSTAGLPLAILPVAAPYRTVFLTLQRLLVGRQISARVDGHTVTLTVTGLQSPLDMGGLALGQLGQVRLSARDVCWDDYRFETAAVVLHNAYLRPGMPPKLVAAPVELSLTLPPEVIDAALRQATPYLRGELHGDGTAGLSLARWPAWGSLAFDVALDGSTLWLKPCAVRTRRRWWRLPARLPAYPLALPELPRGLVVTDVEVDADVLRISGALQQWRIDLPLRHIEDIIVFLTQRAGTLDLAWPSLNILSR